MPNQDQDQVASFAVFEANGIYFRLNLFRLKWRCEQSVWSRLSLLLRLRPLESADLVDGGRNCFKHLAILINLLVTNIACGL